MATPYVAGAVALIRSVAPHSTVLEVRRALLDSTAPLSGGASRVAHGRLDAAAALARVVVTEPEPEPEPDPEEPAEPTPADWTYVEYGVESPHPYANDFSGSVNIEAPTGATEMRLHFDRIDVEANYDFVVVKDAHGTKLAEWTGDQGAVSSDAFAVGWLSLHLFTDGSVTDWGLALAGYSWR
jgi:hypothetical protein